MRNSCASSPMMPRRNSRTQATKPAPRTRKTPFGQQVFRLRMKKAPAAGPNTLPRPPITNKPPLVSLAGAKDGDQSGIHAVWLKARNPSGFVDISRELLL